MNITLEELYKKNNINIIDIRSANEYNNNHIRNAINIPKILLINYPQQYLNKHDKYYLYCNNGINSYNVCCFLKKRGYNVYNIINGYK